MNIERKIIQRKQRRKLRSRRRRMSKTNLPRVAVFRSLNHIYAQLIDDQKRATLASGSTVEFRDIVGDKSSQAHEVGLRLAEKVKRLGLEKAIFDRGAYLYHGRVKALADGLREGGLKI